jgi:8-oxo-dGTP pyrophosphatase MutT (NUDIX family)
MKVTGDAPAETASGAPVVRRKAFAYVTHRDAAGEWLLIFSHPNAPAAGLQVPAGTLDDGEDPEAGALREAHEETGLTDLEVVAFLGEHLRDMRDVGRNELHHRFFFHLRCTGEPPERWYVREDYPSDQMAAGKVTDRPLFECFWVRLPDGVPPLTTDHGHFLPRLIDRLASTAPRA